MRITRNGTVCLFEDVLPPGIIAGFTLPQIAGNKPPADEIRPVLSPRVPQALSVSWCTQPHEEKISVVEKTGVFPTDGLLTSLEREMLVVRTADCMPLYICSPKNGSIGVLHLGWKSIDRGILKTLADLFRDKKPDTLTCITGPGLRKCCYEVKEDFLSTTLAPFVQKRGRQYFFDPLACIEAQCAQLNLSSVVYDSGLCTLCGKEKFHSYRRDKTNKRILSFIYRAEI